MLFKQKTAYEIYDGLVGSEMCIRDSHETFCLFRRARPTYDPNGSAKAWVYAIAHNVFLMSCRSEKRRGRHEELADDELPDVPVPAEAEAFATKDAVRKALGRLSVDRREAGSLHHAQGLSLPGVGAGLGNHTMAAQRRRTSRPAATFAGSQQRMNGIIGACRPLPSRSPMSATLRLILAAICLLLLGIAGSADARPSNKWRIQCNSDADSDGVVTLLLSAGSTVAIFTTVGIVLAVLFESIRFFHKVPLTDCLLGLKWSPQTALRADQIGSSGAFGVVPLFAGTLLISGIAMLVAVGGCGENAAEC